MSCTWFDTKCQVRSLSGTSSPSATVFGRIVGDDVAGGLEAAIGVIGLLRFGGDHLWSRARAFESVRQVPEIMPPPPMGATT